MGADLDSRWRPAPVDVTIGRQPPPPPPPFDGRRDDWWRIARIAGLTIGLFATGLIVGRMYDTDRSQQIADLRKRLDEAAQILFAGQELIDHQLDRHAIRDARIEGELSAIEAKVSDLGDHHMRVVKARLEGNSVQIEEIRSELERLRVLRTSVTPKNLNDID